MKKTKVLFFIPQLVGGGAERVSINFMRILDKNIFEIHLAVTNINGPSFNYLPEEIVIHDLKVSKTIFSIMKLRKLIQKLEPNIVFSSLIRGHIAINIASLFIRKNIFIALRSPNSPKLLLEHNQLGYINKSLLESAYKAADIILAQTPEMKNEIIKYHGIDNSKIKFFLNPLDTGFIDEKIKNIKNPFDETMVNVVASGRLTKQKGFDILIKSFKKVLEKRADFYLHIIGNDDGEEDKLKKIVRELSLENNISFLGYKINPYEYYYYADLYVLSSRWEGLPNTILENLYLNKPIVATRCIPFMDKLIDNGNNGILVDIENIKQLADAILSYDIINKDNKDNKEISNGTNALFLSFLKKVK